MLETYLNMAYYSATDDITFTPLTEEREAELFKTFYRKNISAARRLAARDELITCHLKLIVKLSLAAAKKAIPDDIAISAGNAALMQAVECRKFRPSSKTRFSGYLRLFVRGQVNKAIAAHHSPRQDDDQNSETRLQFSPESALTGQLSRHAFTNSYSHPSTVPRDDLMLVTVDHDYEAQELSRERIRAIEKVMTRLHGLEAAAVRKVHLEGQSYAEVARKHRVSRQAVEQANHRGLKKLRVLLSRHKSDLL